VSDTEYKGKPSHGHYGKFRHVDVWSEIIWPIKTYEDYRLTTLAMMDDLAALREMCGKDDESLMRLRYYGARLFAVGIIRGMQQGTVLGLRSTSPLIAAVLKHPSVVKLLLTKPVASSLDICKALDKARAPLPRGTGVWNTLRKDNPKWAAWAEEQNVKMLISQARKEATQASLDERFLALVKGIGDVGSVFDERFNVKPRPIGKTRT
jgi:hypothetical protein